MSPRPSTGDVDPDARRSFLDERRASSQSRYDTEIAATYDEEWGDLSPSHRRFMERFLELVPEDGIVLDAACGTGRVWPMILGAGRAVVGADQSQAMLDRASIKHPRVETVRVALQDLGFIREFDGVVCVDAIENVGPEDWPLVLERLSAAGKRQAPIYLTSELPEDDDPYLTDGAEDFGAPVVEGESFDGVGYHYYPDRNRVLAWFDEAGLDVVHESDADGYRHFLLRRR